MRPKEYLDGALPATNSIAVHGAAAGQRCSTTTDELRDAAERTVSEAWRALLTRHPGALADLVAALPMLAGRQEIVDHRRPARPPGRGAPAMAARAPSWPGASRTNRRSSPDRPEGAAYVCRGFACNAPAARRRPRWRRTARGPAPMTEDTMEPAPTPAPTTPRGPGAPPEVPTDPARLLRRSARRREKVPTAGGSTLHLLVLSSTLEDTTVVDLATRTVMRVRVPWPEDYEPDITAFDVVEVTLADDPERDDLAQPEATTAADLPRHVGTLRGRQLRKLLRRMVASPDGPLLGFPGPSAPYWEFRGFRPSVALIEPTRSPQLIRRQADGSTWVRFGWDRDDVWLPVEDRHAARALDAARRERLSGKSLATALGFDPQYLLVTVSPPRDGHCYKVCAAVLPRG